MILALALAACTSAPKDTADSSVGDSGGGDDTADSSVDSVDTSDSDPCDKSLDSSTIAVTIEAPTNGAVLAVGAAAALDATYHRPVTPTSVTWTANGDPIASSADGSALHTTWTPGTAATWTLGVTVESVCGTSTATVDVTTADEAVPTITAWENTDGLPLASWYGMSVGLDGTVWGATSAGLLHFDPATGAIRTYLRADGLYTDYPRAVLAASDGTIWVGHVGDTTRQGEQIALNADGTLTVLQFIDYTGSEEQSAAFRIREQPFGEGAGDIYMGMNEGVCMYDQSLGVFLEHLHPTHPHGYGYGLAFSPEGHIWDADQYQISRWQYLGDGVYNSTSNLLEYWVPWPVAVEVPVDTRDADMQIDGSPPTGFESTLWLASGTYGVDRIQVAEAVGASTTEAMGAPFPATATAVRWDGDAHLWIGTADGLYVWDPAAETMAVHNEDWLPSGAIQQLAVDTNSLPPAVWIATPYALVRVIGVPE